MRIVLVGLGSIGKRHARNLEDLGHQVTPIDLGDPLKFDYDCAFICSPTQYHTEHAYEYLKQGVPTFIEKPLTYSGKKLDKFIQDLAGNSTISMVGCNLRFHPAIRRAKDLVERHRCIFARAEYGYYLPFWRKGDYTKSYSASKYGGVILDDIHELDYLYWLFGKFKYIKILSDKVSNLDIKKEDTAETSIIFEDGVSASLHQDYLMKNYHRILELTFAHKKVSYTLFPTNLMFKKEIEYFLSCVQSKYQPMNGIKEAGYVLSKVFENNSNNTGKTNEHKVTKESLKKD